jgi:pimeloyl-ACP methyl ester carboxylesterase
LIDTDPDSYAYVCDALAELDLRGREAELPLLVALGKHDPVVTVDDMADAVLLAGCGHLPAAEDPGAVATLLRAFFTTQRGAR